METPSNDGQLLRRCRSGEESALAELIGRYEQRIYRVAYRVSGDRALAEIATILDATREALKMRLARARKRMRLVLEADEIDTRT